MLDIEFAEFSDCGLIRPNNEDYVGHAVPANPQQGRSRGWMFVVADGVGGQDRGEVASRMTVETMLAGFAKWTANGNPTALLADAVQAANSQVFEAGHGTMATTVVACALRFDRATIAHVGDSRCYLIRNGRTRLLTRDHTVSNDQVRLGLFSEQEARRVPTRGVLSRSIGNDLFVKAEVNVHNVRAGDLLLLCTDGLHGAVSDEKIGRIATSSQEPGASLEEAARQLISVANQSDGGDNVSVQLIRVRDAEAVGMYRGRPYRLH